MTDARFPERWLNDRRLLRLTDQAFRLHITALVWSVANRTDGLVYDDDLPLIPVVDHARSAELAKARLWRRERDYWVIADYADTQTSADEIAALENIRRSARDRKARERAKKAMSRDGPVDGHGDAHRTGQARPGQARTGYEEEGPQQELEEEDWPEVAGPSSGERSWSDDLYDRE